MQVKEQQDVGLCAATVSVACFDVLLSLMHHCSTGDTPAASMTTAHSQTLVTPLALCDQPASFKLAFYCDVLKA